MLTEVAQADPIREIVSHQLSGRTRQQDLAAVGR